MLTAGFSSMTPSRVFFGGLRYISYLLIFFFILLKRCMLTVSVRCGEWFFCVVFISSVFSLRGSISQM